MKKYLALVMFALMFGLVLVPTTVKATGVSVEVRADTIDVSSDLNITYNYGDANSLALHNGKEGWLAIFIVNQLSNDTHRWFVIKEFRGKADWNTTWRIVKPWEAGGNVLMTYVLYGHKKYATPIVGYNLYPPERVLNGVHKFYTMMTFTLYGDGWGDMANKTLGVVNTTFSLYVNSPYHDTTESGSGITDNNMLLYVGIGIAILVVAVVVAIALKRRH